MSDPVLVPLGGRLLPQAFPKAVSADPVLLFDIEIPIRVAVSSPVGPAFFPRRPTRVSIEDVDLGVSDWRQLSGKDIAFPASAEWDAAVYLATVHNPVKLRRIRFGRAGEQTIQALIELELDFRCVKPRPPELESSLRVSWVIDFEVIRGEEAS
jgi:hypothetical protein